MRTSHFREYFVEYLKGILPPSVKELDLSYPSVPTGYVRFNEDSLDSVYLSEIRHGDGSEIGLKFNYRNFAHLPHLPSDYVFSRIYYSEDWAIEYGYNKDLELDGSKYMKLPAIESRLGAEDLNHQLDVLIEWREVMRKFHSGETDYWVTAYQIEKFNQKVKIPYVGIRGGDGLESIKNIERLEKLDEIIEGFNPEECLWGFKGSINEQYEVIADHNNLNVIRIGYYEEDRQHWLDKKMNLWKEI